MFREKCKFLSLISRRKERRSSYGCIVKDALNFYLTNCNRAAQHVHNFGAHCDCKQRIYLKYKQILQELLIKFLFNKQQLQLTILSFDDYEKMLKLLAYHNNENMNKIVLTQNSKFD